jgi:hypothetical protein
MAVALARERPVASDRRPWRAALASGGPAALASDRRPWRAAAALWQARPGDEIRNPHDQGRFLAELSPPTTGSGGLLRSAAGSSHVQVPERLAER